MAVIHFSFFSTCSELFLLFIRKEQVMPWNLKVFIGFLSDTKPIRGLRRKPYMFIGTFVCATAWILLGLWPQESLAIGWMCMLLFLGVSGMIVGDVMADALVVERVKFEAIKGSIQAQCWMLRFGGGLSGLLSAGWLLEYGHVHPKSIFFANVEPRGENKKDPGNP